MMKNFLVQRLDNLEKQEPYEWHPEIHEREDGKQCVVAVDEDGKIRAFMSFSAYETICKLKKDNGLDAIAPGNQASAELCKSIGWGPPTRKPRKKKKCKGPHMHS